MFLLTLLAQSVDHKTLCLSPFLGILQLSGGMITVGTEVKQWMLHHIEKAQGLQHCSGLILSIDAIGIKKNLIEMRLSRAQRWLYSNVALRHDDRRVK